MASLRSESFSSFFPRTRAPINFTTCSCWACNVTRADQVSWSKSLRGCASPRSHYGKHTNVKS
eukprot:2990376-Pyramimonas_sp.AAC.1